MTPVTVRGANKCKRRPEVKRPSAKTKRAAPLHTPTGLGANASKDIAAVLTTLLADVFTLYLKTKNFHWHVSGPRFRDLHLLFDEHAGELLAMTDEIAERARKVGGPTLKSIGEIGRLQRLSDNEADYVTPLDMVAELKDDNMRLATFLRETHAVCDEHGDVATASLIENWVDATEKRIWFLFEISRPAEG